MARRAFVQGAAGAAAVCAAGLAGCSGGDEDVSAEPTNPSAGKLGGKLTIYTSCSESLVNAVVPAFMVEHAVAVQVVRGTTGELMDLVAGEVAAGAPVADVIWGGDASWYADTERFETYVSGENRSVRDDCRNVGGVATPVTREVPVLVGGPALASGDAALLGGYADLRGYAGGVALEDPAVSEATLVALAALEEGADLVEDSVVGVGTAAGDGEAAEAAVAETDAADAEAPESADGVAETDAETPESADDAVTSDLVASQEKAVEPLRPAELRTLGTVVSGDELGDGEAVLRAVLDGRAPVGVALEQEAVAEARAGSDLQVIYPVEEPAGVACCTAAVRSCANLEQAHAWIDFVTGQACQQVLVREAFARPARDDAGAPEGLPELGEALTVEREGLLASWAEEPEADAEDAGDESSESSDSPTAAGAGA